MHGGNCGCALCAEFTDFQAAAERDCAGGYGGAAVLGSGSRDFNRAAGAKTNRHRIKGAAAFSKRPSLRNRHGAAGHFAPISLMAGLTMTSAANASLLNHFEIAATSVIAMCV